MGYSTSPELFEANRKTLEVILRNASEGRDSRFPTPPGYRIEQFAYHFHRILKAAERHAPQGSPLSDLREKIKVTTSRDSDSVVCMLKRKASLRNTDFQNLREALPSLSSAIEELKRYRGEMKQIEFEMPKDMTLEDISLTLKDRGWELHTVTREDLERGTVRFAVERIQPRQKSFSDILKEYSSG